MIAATGSTNWGGPRSCIRGGRGSVADFLKNGKLCRGEVCLSSNRAGLTRTAEMFSQGHAVCDLCARTMSPEALKAANRAASGEPGAESGEPVSRHAAKAPRRRKDKGSGGQGDKGKRRLTPSPCPLVPPSCSPVLTVLPTPPPVAAPVQTPSVKSVSPAPPRPRAAAGKKPVDRLAEATGKALIDILVERVSDALMRRLVSELRKG